MLKPAFGKLNCNHKGHLVSFGRLRNFSVLFSPVLSKSKILTADFNTSVCKKSNLSLNENDYIKLQNLAANGSRALIVLTTVYSPVKIVCLDKVYELKELKGLSLNFIQDDCTKNQAGEVGVRSSDKRIEFYTGLEEAKLILHLANSDSKDKT